MTHGSTLSRFSLLVLLGAPLACAEDPETLAPGAGGTNAAGSGASANAGGSGSATGGTGAATSGGNSSGGTSSGGALTGGTESGGASGGGSSTGGAESGGTSGGGSKPDAIPSSGCTQDSGLQSGKHSLDVEGETREYIVSVPDGPFDTARPLIFGFHGMMYDAEWVANGEEPTSGPYFGMEAEAAGAAIFVAPQALSGGWSNQGGRDISFVEAMISELSAQLCVDEARIFATGFSFGGIMTANIGCELFDSFRAVAPQSASLPSVCTDGLPALPYLGIHGTEDTTIQLSQGELVRDSYVARNGCDMSASGPDENGCMVYENCEPEAPVTFCTFTGVHEPAPFTGPVIWNFFAQF